ncbi:MAG: hypothetical protein EXR73_05560 [Myxococcales bacterium]|nr:hypothetical protein [Myxococcales bacterium]
MQADAGAHARKVPRATFLLGALIGLAAPPLVGVALLLLARTVGIGDAASTAERNAHFALLFAGLPALLSGGGVARLVAHRLAERAGPPRLRTALALGVSAMALASIGLAILTAVPLGELPEEPLGFAPIAAAGLVAGMLPGATIGLITLLRQRRHQALRAAPPSETPP